MSKRIQTCPSSTAHVRGFSLVELMVALVLGLIVIAGAGSVFLASSQTYRTNQALSEVQTNARIGFELLARDIREAGLSGCNNNGRIANVLNDKATDWYANWANAVRGYDTGQVDPAIIAGTGTGVGQHVAGTDSLEILSAGSSGLSVAKHNATSAQFKLNESSSNLASGDFIIVCDPDHTALVQITNYNSSNVTLVHNTGTGSPGNCSKGLGYPTVCSTNGNSYTFPPNSQIAKLAATDWYIGNNPAGGKSLYRIQVATSAGVPTPTAQEMVRNVTDMQLQYLQPPNTDFVDANLVTNWSIVNAVRMTLRFQSTDQRAGTDIKPITRTLTSTTTIRNRVK